MRKGWTEKSIDELAFVGRGKSRHRPRNDPSLYGGEHPFVQTAEIHNADLWITSFKQTYSDNGLAQSKMWDPGTICITNAGENTGDCAVLGIRACFPDSIIAVIADDSKSDTVFLKYAIDQLKPRLRRITRGATQDNLSVAKLTVFTFPTPPLKEQRRIGAVVRAYGDLIENNRRRIQLLEQAARLLYKEWFVHLRFPGHEHVTINDGVPEGWEKKALLDIASPTYGFAFKSKLFNTDGEGLPVARIRDIPPGRSQTYTTEEAPEEKLLQDGDFVIGMDGDFHMNFWTGGKAWINQRVVRIRGAEDVTDAFLRYACEKPIQDFNATIVGTTVAHLGAKHLKLIEVLIPPKVILYEAQDLCDSIRSQIVALSSQSTHAKRARDLLLPRLMNGEVAV